jgi:SAM-dependent methyltransferase
MGNDFLAATRVQIGEGVDAVGATPPDIRRRYIENRNWRRYPKEYIYHRLQERGAATLRVLDFGCGTGEISTQLALLGCTVVGIDVTPELIAIAARRAQLDGVRARCSFVEAPIQEAGLADRSFDVVLCFAVLHHVDIRAVMPHLLRVLKPGGIFFAVEPVVLVRWLGRLRDVIPVPKPPLDEGERQLTGEDLRFLRSGLQSSQVRYFRLFERLERILPGLVHPLAAVDEFLLSALPFLRCYSGTALIEGVGA